MIGVLGFVVGVIFKRNYLIEKVYFYLWFRRSRPQLGWLCCFGPKASKTSWWRKQEQAELGASWQPGSREKGRKGSGAAGYPRVSPRVASFTQLAAAPSRPFSMKSLMKAILPWRSHLSVVHNQVGPSVQPEDVSDKPQQKVRVQSHRRNF